MAWIEAKSGGHRVVPEFVRRPGLAGLLLGLLAGWSAGWLGVGFMMKIADS